MKEKTFLLLLIFGLSSCLFGQSARPITIKPKDFNIKGKVAQSYYWLDSSGNNYLILMANSRFHDKQDPHMVGTDLRAFHFISKGKTRILLWELTDSISSCPEDLELSAGFMLEGFEVTDLDNNGLGETWLIYKMSCRGDVSPATMKIAMHEGVKKYLICGENRVPYKDGKYLGGQREMDDNFINGPKQFSEFGSALWDRFIDETFK